jgi:uncharacterized RDD family membrane protein YckC
VSPLEHAVAPSSGGLLDLPLRADQAPAGFGLPIAAETVDTAPEVEPESAPLFARTIAFAADLAGTSLAVTLALMAAVTVCGRAPRLSGLPWAALFGLEFSFFFVVLPLTLFGRTVGMSLAGIAARPGRSGRPLTPGEASRRWAGTVISTAALGIPVLLTARDRLRPTPADRLSGRTLVRDTET